MDNSIIDVARSAAETVYTALATANAETQRQTEQYNADIRRFDKSGVALPVKVVGAISV